MKNVFEFAVTFFTIATTVAIVYFFNIYGGKTLFSPIALGALVLACNGHLVVKRRVIEKGLSAVGVSLTVGCFAAIIQEGTLSETVLPIITACFASFFIPVFIIAFTAFLLEKDDTESAQRMEHTMMGNLPVVGQVLKEGKATTKERALTEENGKSFYTSAEKYSGPHIHKKL